MVVYVNDSKPTSSFSYDGKPSLGAVTIAAGQSMGLLLTITYAVSQTGTGEFYTNDSKPTSSFSLDTKPS